MKLFEDAWEYCALKVNGTTKIKHTYKDDKGNKKEVELDFKTPWKRLSMTDAIKQFVGIDVLEMEDKAVLNYVNEKGIEYEGELSWGYAVELIFEEYCEDKIIQPTHITNHPRGSTPLCKKDRKNNRLLERFESACLGMELCNAYSELNDPITQRRLLEEQSNDEVNFGDMRKEVDTDFIEAIETGMPPAGGLGIGLDRMIMLLTGAETIKDVILFPTMKPEKKEEEYKVIESGEEKK
jgi:lysyl-tRNA synthetase class 2